MSEMSHEPSRQEAKLRWEEEGRHTETRAREEVDKLVVTEGEDIGKILDPDVAHDVANHEARVRKNLAWREQGHRVTEMERRDTLRDSGTLKLGMIAAARAKRGDEYVGLAQDEATKRYEGILDRKDAA